MTLHARATERPQPAVHTEAGRRRRVRLAVVSAAAVAVVGAGVALLGTLADQPEAGDCLREPGSQGTEIVQVDCGSVDARYEVIGVDAHPVGWGEFYSESNSACRQFSGVDLQVPLSALDQDDPEVRSSVLCLHSLLGS